MFKVLNMSLILLVDFDFCYSFGGVNSFSIDIVYWIRDYGVYSPVQSEKETFLEAEYC